MVVATGTKVSFGVHDAMVEGVGKTVGDIRASHGQIMNVPPDAYAVIDGKRVSDAHIIQQGQEVEFIKEAGVKG